MKFRKTLTLSEASEFTGVPASTIRRWVLDGLIPAEKIGKTWVVSRSAVRKIEKRKRSRG